MAKPSVKSNIDISIVDPKQVTFDFLDFLKNLVRDVAHRGEDCRVAGHMGCATEVWTSPAAKSTSGSCNRGGSGAGGAQADRLTCSEFRKTAPNFWA